MKKALIAGAFAACSFALLGAIGYGAFKATEKTLVTVTTDSLHDRSITSVVRTNWLGCTAQKISVNVATGARFHEIFEFNKVLKSFTLAQIDQDGQSVMASIVGDQVTIQGVPVVGENAEQVRAKYKEGSEICYGIGPSSPGQENTPIQSQKYTT